MQLNDKSQQTGFNKLVSSFLDGSAMTVTNHHDQTHNLVKLFSEDGMTVNSPRIWRFLKSMPSVFHWFQGLTASVAAIVSATAL